MSNTHTNAFTIVVDSYTQQLKSKVPYSIPLNTVTKGNTTLELIELTPDKSDYRINYIVHVNKRRLGMLGMHHYKAVVDKELMSFRIDNYSLYRDFIGDMTQFINDFQLELANITSLEIAIDTNKDLITDFCNYFNKPDEYHYHYTPTSLEELQKLRMVGDVWRDGSHNFSLYPTISADKKIKIYNKSLDIIEKKKDYITDYHTLNRLDTTTDVYRVELTLLNTAFKTKEYVYKKENDILNAYEYKQLSETDKSGFTELTVPNDKTPSYLDLRNPEILLSIFNKYTNGFKAFSKKDNPRKTRCTPVVLLDLGNVKELKGIQYVVENKTYKIQMTATFKTLLRNYYATKNIAFMQTAELLASTNNCTDELEKQIKALEPLRTLYSTPRHTAGITSF